MTGWLIVNEFLNTDKYAVLNEWLLKAGKKQGIDFILKTNAQVMTGLLADIFTKEEKPDFVLFWDKDIRLARQFEDMGIRVFNSAKAIEICDDKSYTALVLEQAGIRTPKTIVAPMTYEGVGYKNLDFLELVVEKLQFPMVVKECFGSFGWQVYLAHTKEELVELVQKICPKPMIFQQFLSSSFGKDLRLQVVGNEVIATMYRYSDSDDFRANISSGGKMKNYEPSEEEKKIALEACKAIGLDFAGVDLLFGENGEPYVCEVNSNAHFKNIYDCTHVNAADHILAYIRQQID